MKRRRQGPQVETFPFLAVLLCAMGSLILLLLVLDRRARVVAQAKARAAAQHVRAEEESTAAARRAEWERRRQTLRASLLRQEEEVRAQVAAVSQSAAEAFERFASEQAGVQTLRDRLQGEQAQLVRGWEELAQQKAQLARADGKTEASRAERAQLTAHLGQLERALAELKALRQRQQQTYSLVPYKGKQGDHRRPIYVECMAHGLIFHPDRLALQGPGVTAREVRDEVERRILRLRAETAAAGGRPERAAYLLMLIRPDGILSYYQTLAALRGIDLDFGYEFIDGGWVLDFPSDDSAPAPQPWMTVAQEDGKRNAGPKSTGVLTGRHSAGTQGGSLPDTGGSNPWHAVPTGSGPAGSGTGDRTGGGSGAALGQPLPYSPGPAGTGGVGTEPNSLLSERGTGFPARPGTPDGLESPSHRKDAMGALMPEKPGTGGGTPAQGTNPQVLPSLSPIPGLATAGVHGPTPTPGRQPSFTGGSGGAPDQPPAVGGGSPAGVGAAGPGEMSRERLLPGKLPGEVTTPDGSAPAVSGGEKPAHPSESLAPRQPGQPAGQSGEEPREPGQGEAAGSAVREPLSRLLPPDPPAKSGRSLPRPTVMLGNRNWTIHIDCGPDAVVVVPTGRRLSTGTMYAGGDSYGQLYEEVRQLIARRQATVRPGEPPYRVQVRFQVRPDGVRAYYLAYPALERLGVPMTRENLDRDEDAKPRPLAR